MEVHLGLFLLALWASSTGADPKVRSTTEPSFAPTGRLSQFRGFASPRPIPDEAQFMYASVWAGWSAWSFCTNGVRIRVRACNTVKGFSCLGPNQETRMCDPREPSLHRQQQKSSSDYDVIDPYEADRREAMRQLYPDEDAEEDAGRDAEAHNRNNFQKLHKSKDDLKLRSAGHTHLGHAPGFHQGLPNSLAERAFAPGATPENQRARQFSVNTFSMGDDKSFEDDKEFSLGVLDITKDDENIPSKAELLNDFDRNEVPKEEVVPSVFTREEQILQLRSEGKSSRGQAKLASFSVPVEAKNKATPLPTLTPPPITKVSLATLLTEATTLSTPGPTTPTVQTTTAIKTTTTESVEEFSTVAPIAPRAALPDDIEKLFEEEETKHVSKVKPKKPKKNIEEELSKAILDMFKPSVLPKEESHEKIFEVEHVKEEPLFEDEIAVTVGSGSVRVTPKPPKEADFGSSFEDIEDLLEKAAPLASSENQADTITEAPLVEATTLFDELGMMELASRGSSKQRKIEDNREKMKGFGKTGESVKKYQTEEARLHFGEVTTKAPPVFIEGSNKELSMDTLNALDWMLQNMTNLAGLTDDSLQTLDLQPPEVHAREADLSSFPVPQHGIIETPEPVSAPVLPKKRKGKKKNRSMKRKHKKIPGEFTKIHSGEFRPRKLDPLKKFPKFQQRELHRGRSRAFGVRTVDGDKDLDWDAGNERTTMSPIPVHEAINDKPIQLMDEITRLQETMRKMENKMDKLDDEDSIVKLPNTPVSYTVQAEEFLLRDQKLSERDKLFENDLYKKKTHQSALDLSLVPQNEGFIPGNGKGPFFEEDEAMRIVSTDSESTDPSARWGDWTPWGTCFCGKRVRTRMCLFHTASSSQGCIGKAHETENCQGGFCPTTTTISMKDATTITPKTISNAERAQASHDPRRSFQPHGLNIATTLS